MNEKTSYSLNTIRLHYRRLPLHHRPLKNRKRSFFFREAEKFAAYYPDYEKERSEAINNILTLRWVFGLDLTTELIYMARDSVLASMRNIRYKLTDPNNYYSHGMVDLQAVLILTIAQKMLEEQEFYSKPDFLIHLSKEISISESLAERVMETAIRLDFDWEMCL